MSDGKNKNTSKGNNFLEDLINEMVMGLSNLLSKVITRLMANIFNWVSQKLGRETSGIIKKTEYKFKHVMENDPSVLGWSNSGKRFIKYNDVEWKHHSFVVGASGSGKTSFLKIAMEGAMMNGKSVVMIDPKGEIDFIKFFKAMCRANGKKFYIFAEGYTGEGAINLNPFKGKDFTDAYSMFENSFTRPGDDNVYYSEAQLQAIKEIILNCLNEKNEISLWLLRERFVKDYGDDKDYNGMRNRLDIFLESGIGKRMIAKDALSLKDIIDEDACVYVGVSTQRHGEGARRICKLFTNELLKISAFRLSMCSNLKYAPSCTAILDEVGSIIEPEFLELINKCRGAKMEIVAVAQSYNDFKRAFPTWEGYESLWECFSNWIVFKQENEKYIERFAKIAGTYLTEKKTDQLNDGVRTGGASTREAYEFCVHPEVFRRLKQGQAVVINKKARVSSFVHHVSFKDIDSSTLYDFENENVEIANMYDYKLEMDKKNKKTQEKDNTLPAIDNAPEFKTKLDLLKELGGVN